MTTQTQVRSTDEALKMALEALKENHYYMIDAGLPNQSMLNKTLTAYKALEEALAKQEPNYKALWQQMCERCDELDAKLAKQERGGWHTHDLYTDADKDRPDVICDSNGQVALGLCKRCGRGEAELETPCDKPKRCEYCKRGLKTMCLCGLNSKQEQGEPVAWMASDDPSAIETNPPHPELIHQWVPLYTHSQPKRKPLTDEQILSVARDHYNPHQRPEISFARAIEAAHNIKENT